MSEKLYSIQRKDESNKVWCSRYTASIAVAALSSSFRVCAQFVEVIHSQLSDLELLELCISELTQNNSDSSSTCKDTSQHCMAPSSVIPHIHLYRFISFPIS
ncbi:uncharacterized protein G2W53_017808 [Senna tora]|uniref:Uncharacterized protein n=1 Tax=Senna tora TaxID=362788 RepID=A0A834TRX3_9FABA|nr:uncharacterized protein G2W53_017808 [Senna tora]